jgi:hypothetical protein
MEELLRRERYGGKGDLEVPAMGMSHAREACGEDIVADGGLESVAGGRVERGISSGASVMSRSGCRLGGWR